MKNELENKCSDLCTGGCSYSRAVQNNPGIIDHILLSQKGKDEINCNADHMERYLPDTNGESAMVGQKISQDFD